MLAATVTIVLWASAFVVIRSSGAHLSPGRWRWPGSPWPPSCSRRSCSAARFAGPGRSCPRGGAILPVVGYGALWFAGYNIALNAAERHVDAGTAALLVNIAPVLIAIGGGLFLREGFSRPLFLGCAVAFGGVALMARIRTASETSSASSSRWSRQSSTPRR